MTNTTTRDSRKSEERVTETRKREWQPPSALDVPDAPDGYEYRWLRTEMMGREDRTNMSKKLREGFELVKPEEIDASYQMPTMTEGQHKGFIGVGGLVLGKLPVEIAEQKRAYYKGRTNDQQQAIDNDLMKESHSAMPIIKPERLSRTSFGSQNTG
jgi:hypothetical protein